MSTARVGTIPPGVTVFCDPTLKTAMRQLDPVSRRAAGAPVAVLCAPAASMLAQITRHTRNDVLFTLSTAMDEAVRMNLVNPKTRVDGFANTLVLAGLGDRMSAPGDLSGLLAMVSEATIAVTDATVVSGLDGRAMLDANGLTKAAGNRVWGAANTGDVAFLVTSSSVDLGLMYLTDIRADPRLTLIWTLQADPALTNYAAAVNAKAVSPNAQTFLNLLKGVEAGNMLRDAGLSVPA
jgi:ABC-type molybdate transport system substrate-binding protein